MRRWVALAAAYLVVLQAIFAGLTSGANAASFSLDRSLAITKPLAVKSNSKLGQFMIGLAWLLSSIFAGPQVNQYCRFFMEITDFLSKSE